jgi:hypothetical protein
LLAVGAFLVLGQKVDPNRQCAQDMTKALKDSSNWIQLRPKLDQINTNEVTDSELLEALPLMRGLSKIYDRANIDLQKVRRGEKLSTWESIKATGTTLTTSEGAEAQIDSKRCALLRRLLNERYKTDYWVLPGQD